MSGHSAYHKPLFHLTISVGRNTSGICKTQFFKYTLNRAGAKMGQTRLDGNFVLRLEPGAYNLIFSHPNYHSVEIPLIVKLDQNDTLNIRLSHQT